MCTVHPVTGKHTGEAADICKLRRKKSRQNTGGRLGLNVYIRERPPEACPRAICTSKVWCCTEDLPTPSPTTVHMLEGPRHTGREAVEGRTSCWQVESHRKRTQPRSHSQGQKGIVRGGMNGTVHDEEALGPSYTIGL